MFKTKTTTVLNCHREENNNNYDLQPVFSEYQNVKRIVSDQLFLFQQIIFSVITSRLILAQKFTESRQATALVAANLSQRKLKH